jgi:hypothetical protein
MRNILLIAVAIIIVGIYFILPKEGKYKDRGQKEWTAQLASIDANKRIQAVQALGEIGAEEGKNTSNTKRGILLAIHKHSLMVPPMIELLKDSDGQVRDATVAALIKIGSYAESDLKEAANLNDPTMHWGAIAVLSLSPEINKDVALLKRALYKEERPHIYYEKYFPKPAPPPIPKDLQEKLNRIGKE